MPFSEHVAARVRSFLYEYAQPEAVSEIRMMGGLCFMYNEKMLVGIVGDELMCRVDPASIPELLERPGCREMRMGGRRMNGYLLVDETAHQRPQEFAFWIRQALAFNDRAKSSRRRA